MTIEIFVHANGRKAAVEKVESADSLASVLERLGLIGKEAGGALAFVGESTSVLIDLESDEAEDQTEPIDLKSSIEELKLHQHRHVHVSHCKRVRVEVHYGAKTKYRKVAPSTTVGILADWARKAFKLDPASASEYVLQINGTKIHPRPDTHVGELVGADTCAITFDLVKEVTAQG